MPIGDFLDQTCNIKVQYSGTDDQDAGGGPVREPQTTLQAGVPCLVREMGGGNDPVNGKATQTKIVRVYFDPDDLDVAITSQYLIEVTSGPAPRELVVSSTVDSNSMGSLLAVDCIEQAV
jgi:hypothetical protein